MLLVVGNTQIRGNDLTVSLQKILPKGWSARFYAEPGHPGFDGRLEVLPPSLHPVCFEVELATRFEPRDIDRMARLCKGLPASRKALLLAPYLSPRSLALLKEHGISHADLTGTLWFSTDSLFIDRIGTEEAPKHRGEGLPRTSLRGPITGRVVRFLCDTRPPLKIRRIAMETNVHAGNVSRIIDFLERERFVERSASGSVMSVDWAALIERWSRDLQVNRRLETFLEPRGIDVVTSHLAGWTLPYAVTGPYASAKIVPVSSPIAIDIYVKDVNEAREALALRSSDRIGNIRLIRAFDRVVFERTLRRESLVLACPSQIAADLPTLPKRSADEYHELLAWMKQHESDWRL
jgi:hypothetical protein